MKTITTDLINYFINEREKARTGEGTQDEVILNSRFCNIRREDDKVSKWIFDNCLTIEQVMLARIVNHVTRLEELRDNQWSVERFIERDGPITNSAAYQFYPKAGEKIRDVFMDVSKNAGLLATYLKAEAEFNDIETLSRKMSEILGRSLHFYFMMVVLDAGHMGLAKVDMNSKPYMGPGGIRVLKEMGMSLEELAKALGRPQYEVEHVACEVRKYVERKEKGIPNNRKRTAPSKPVQTSFDFKGE